MGTLTRGYGTLNLLVWDLAGGDNFDSSSSYLRGTSGGVIVCDLTRHDTLSAFERYAAQVRAVNPGVPLVFVGNKVDLVDQRAITHAELQKVCAALNGSFLLASAKTGEQVEETFLAVAEQLDLQL
jgi:small GTP-binding protein